MDTCAPRQMEYHLLIQPIVFHLMEHHAIRIKDCFVIIQGQIRGVIFTT
jgi:hypothetical protein